MTPQRTVAVLFSTLYIIAYWLFLLYALCYFNSCKTAEAWITDNAFESIIQRKQIPSYGVTSLVYDTTKKNTSPKVTYTYYFVLLKEGLWQIAAKQKIPIHKTAVWIEIVVKLNHLTVKDSNGNYKILTGSVLKLPKTL